MRALYDLLLWDDRYANRVRYALERGLGIDDGDDDQAEPQLDGPSKPAPPLTLGTASTFPTACAVRPRRWCHDRDCQKRCIETARTSQLICKHNVGGMLLSLFPCSTESSICNDTQ